MRYAYIAAAAYKFIGSAEQPWRISAGILPWWCVRSVVPTARAWRNGWFHTGDMFRKDDAGNYYFVDRSKHVIRRRGENISSFEVEQEALGHPVIKAAAAYAVPDGRGDCEVMLAVEPGENKKIDLADLAAHLETRLPKHMVPRFMRVLPNLPRSASDKVSKIELAETGVTPDTWDRQSEPTLAAD